MVEPLPKSTVKRWLTNILGYVRAHSENPVKALSTYDLQHLPEHLESAGLVAELHALLVLESTPKTGTTSRLQWLPRWTPFSTEVGPAQNAWFSENWTVVLLKDIWPTFFARGDWRTRHFLDGSADRLNNLRRQLLYALMIASVRSRASRFPECAARRAFRHRLIPLQEALAMARQVPDLARRAESLTLRDRAIRRREPTYLGRQRNTRYHVDH